MVVQDIGEIVTDRPLQLCILFRQRYENLLSVIFQHKQSWCLCSMWPSEYPAPANVQLTWQWHCEKVLDVDTP